MNYIHKKNEVPRTCRLKNFINLCSGRRLDRFLKILKSVNADNIPSQIMSRFLKVQTLDEKQMLRLIYDAVVIAHNGSSPLSASEWEIEMHWADFKKYDMAVELKTTNIENMKRVEILNAILSFFKELAVAFNKKGLVIKVGVYDIDKTIYRTFKDSSRLMNLLEEDFIQNTYHFSGEFFEKVERKKSEAGIEKTNWIVDIDTMYDKQAWLVLNEEQRSNQKAIIRVYEELSDTILAAINIDEENRFRKYQRWYNDLAISGVSMWYSTKKVSFVVCKNLMPIHVRLGVDGYKEISNVYFTLSVGNCYEEKVLVDEAFEIERIVDKVSDIFKKVELDYYLGAIKLEYRVLFARRFSEEVSRKCFDIICEYVGKDPLLLMNTMIIQAYDSNFRIKTEFSGMCEYSMCIFESTIEGKFVRILILTKNYLTHPHGGQIYQQDSHCFIVENEDELKTLFNPEEAFLKYERHIGAI